MVIADDIEEFGSRKCVLASLECSRIEGRTAIVRGGVRCVREVWSLRLHR